MHFLLPTRTNFCHFVANFYLFGSLHTGWTITQGLVPANISCFRVTCFYRELLLTGSIIYRCTYFTISLTRATLSESVQALKFVSCKRIGESLLLWSVDQQRHRGSVRSVKKCYRSGGIYGSGSLCVFLWKCSHVEWSNACGFIIVALTTNLYLGAARSPRV